MGALACILITAVIFFGELWIKNRMEREDPLKLPRPIWGNRILLRKCYNKGAMLHLGQCWSNAVAAVSVLFCAVLSVAFLLSLGRKGGKLLRVGLAILLGGAFSNTYDRLKRKYVVDYFSFQVKWEPLRQIVFNISDFAILIGAMLMVISKDSTVPEDSLD